MLAGRIEEREFFMQTSPAAPIAFAIAGLNRNFVCADRNAFVVSQAVLAGSEYPLSAVSDFLGDEVRIVVDIGANMGAFSFLSAHRWPQARIFAFEPGPSAYACLSHNLEGLAQAQSFNIGLGRGESRQILHDSRYGTIGASIGTAGVNSGEGHAIVVRDAGTALGELEITAIDILKLDTEGCEVAIVESPETLLPKIGIIFIEYHSEDDRRRLDGLLAATHALVNATVTSAHRGTFCYASRRWAERWDNLRIEVPM
jgi:FkbM family methyltransferase